MRIHGNLPQLPYPTPVPAPRADASRRPVPETSSAGTRSSNALSTARVTVDVYTGVTPRAQRAVSAYVENEVFAQRSEYAQLLGVDVYV